MMLGELLATFCWEETEASGSGVSWGQTVVTKIWNGISNSTSVIPKFANEIFFVSVYIFVMRASFQKEN